MALRSLARSIAKEYGPRALSCNVVLPAPDGRARAGAGPALAALAETALFLASPAASFVNGEALVVRAPAARGSSG
jgi:NAD(P)-dependent dehydrogenase (short-subunit alcohol dehydrogenase family)